MLLRAAQFYLKQVTGKLVSEISQDDIQVYLSIGQLENKSGTLKRSCVVLQFLRETQGEYNENYQEMFLKLPYQYLIM